MARVGALPAPSCARRPERIRRHRAEHRNDRASVAPPGSSPARKSSGAAPAALPHAPQTGRRPAHGAYRRRSARAVLRIEARPLTRSVSGQLPTKLLKVEPRATNVLSDRPGMGYVLSLTRFIKTRVSCRRAARGGRMDRKWLPLNA